jgi:hypothetical protein
MIWATFEHIGNTPNETYQFTNGGGNIVTKNRETTVPPSQDTGGNWLFSMNQSNGPFNTPRMNALTLNQINADTGQTIGRSDTLRINPWGSPAGSNASHNSQVVSINNNVRFALGSGDVRKNYLFHGATWTKGGVGAPIFGLQAMANSTIETYQQSNSINCFTCHSGDALGTTTSTAPYIATGLSHIFGPLQPLFP